MERGGPGRRYLLGGENLTLVGLLGILSEPDRRARPALAGPVLRWGWRSRVVSEFWADRVTGQPPKATVTGVRLTRRTMHFDPSFSHTELGISPRPIREALADSVEWLRRTGRVPAAAGCYDARRGRSVRVKPSLWTRSGSRGGVAPRPRSWRNVLVLAFLLEGVMHRYHLRRGPLGTSSAQIMLTC